MRKEVIISTLHSDSFKRQLFWTAEKHSCPTCSQTLKCAERVTRFQLKIPNSSTNALMFSYSPMAAIFRLKTGVPRVTASSTNEAIPSDVEKRLITRSSLLHNRSCSLSEMSFSFSRSFQSFGL